MNRKAIDDSTEYIAVLHKLHTPFKKIYTTITQPYFHIISATTCKLCLSNHIFHKIQGQK